MDLQGTLETLVRSTLQQVGMVRDAAVRQARSSRARLDEVMLQRRRRDAFAELGEAVYDVLRDPRAGDLAANPDIAELVAEIADIEEQLDDAPDDAVGAAPVVVRDADPADYEAVSSASWRDRTNSAGAPRRHVPVWRPTDPDAITPAEPGEPDRWPGDSAAASDSGSDSAVVSDGRADDRSAARRARPGRRPRRGPARGGITFVSDAADGDAGDDLAQYMHEDDVPE